MKKINHYIITIILSTVWLMGQFPSIGDIDQHIEDAFSEIEGELSLYFFNALDGAPIENAEVVMNDIGSFNTDADGKIQFKIPEDAFAQIPVSVRKEGFANTDFTLRLQAGTLFLNRFSISPSIPLEHIRLVLDWGENPSDLDAHFVKHNGYHISYRFKKETTDGVAMLDRDDTNGFGPETITVTSMDVTGDYDYYIHDYSNNSSNNSNELSKSRAEVKVYGQGRLLYHFQVPQNKKGHTWQVFKIENNAIVIVNTVGID
ncbi:MAG: hypothetical protein HOI47_31615 [Candidatus Scalindua sp.]|nr:hypothetical protein [Cytophagia bacterium]MBT6231211.1 hypothetical protein [Candidatus Scalindua sp.]